MEAQKFYTPEELEKQYNVRDSRVDYETKGFLRISFFAS